MSGNLVDRTNNEYIQSPIDDIESFIWVTLFAKLNNSIIAPSPKEKMWAEDFESDKREETLRNFGSGGLFQAGMNPLLEKWSSVLRRLSGEYNNLVDALSMIGAKKGWKNEREEAKYWEAAWHGYALQGVCESLELILKYIDE